jgi:hypothetical protein
MVCTQHLAQKDPERNQRRIDPVHPASADRCQRLRNDLLGEHIAEWKISILKKLPSEETDLLPKPSVVRIPHPCGLLASDGTLAKNHLRKRGLFAHVSFNCGLAEIYVPFVTSTGADEISVLDLPAQCLHCEV